MASGRVRSYKLQATSYELRVTSYELQATSYELQATSYELRVTSYKLRATSYELQVSSCKIICYPPHLNDWLMVLRFQRRITKRFDFVINEKNYPLVANERKTG